MPIMVKNSRKGKPGAGAGSVAKVCGMAHHSQASHKHGIATSWVNMEIIMKFGEALPCVKSPVSRTSGPIYAVT